MAGLQVGGLASGMDTESIITQLMSIEQAPRNRAARQGVTIQARQDALRADRHQAHEPQAGRRRPALGRAVVAQADRHQRHRGRAHGPPGHRRGPRRLHRQRLLSGQRRLAHLCVERRRRQPQRRLQVRRRRRHHDQDLRPDGHEPGRRRLHRQQRRHVAGVGGQRRREALALAPRDRRSRHLGLRRLRDRPWALSRARATAPTPRTPSRATPPPIRRTRTSPPMDCPASS